MSQAIEPRAQAPVQVSNVLVGIGSLLLGLAALVIATQWDRYPTYTVEMPRDTSGTKYGYSITTEKETDALGRTRIHYYLLDRDTGRIWTKNEYNDKWEEVKVESLTPDSSPASRR